MSRYKIPASLAERIRKQARYRCGYCLVGEHLIGMQMEFEHLVPLAEGGQTLEENLWLSCRNCNGFKHSQTKAIDPESGLVAPLFNPRRQNWNEHFRWSEDRTEIIALTPEGRASVVALRLNNPLTVVARRLWVSAGWWPPMD
jgi:hypothetical protein